LHACRSWQAQQYGAVHHVFKGMNPWSEHYSAVCAEVPDPDAPETGMNHVLLQRLAASDTVVIAGEASSHCVRATTEHIVQHWGRPADHLVLLTDCMSPVSGFETAQQIFLQNMQDAGVRCLPSTALHLF